MNELLKVPQLNVKELVSSPSSTDLTVAAPLAPVSDAAPKGSPNTVTAPVIDFGEPPSLRACSSNSCPNGHEWTPVIQLTNCPGCKAPILAIKMVQCPVCNEPVSKFRLRTDHLAQNTAIMPVCRGSQSLAEVTEIEMTRGHASKEEGTHKVREVLSKV